MQRAAYRPPTPVSVVISALFIAAAFGAAALFGGGYVYKLAGLGRSDAWEVTYASCGVAAIGFGLYWLRGGFRPDDARFLGSIGFARICHDNRRSYVVRYADVAAVRTSASARKARVRRTFYFLDRHGREFARESGHQTPALWPAKPKIASESALHAYATAAAKACERASAPASSKRIWPATAKTYKRRRSPTARHPENHERFACDRS